MKRVKMVLYGEPGTGKSVFACRADKPFFICTDGNYEWLEEFGAKEEDHVNVSSWAEISALIDNPKSFDGYETVVVDLLEDAFKWCEQEYCKRNNIEHVSDQGYGKGWDSSRNEFFIGISKLLALDKHIILIMHGITWTEKDRRGVDHTKHGPSTRVPDKVLDMIEGKVRYFLRCYVQDEEFEDGTLVKKRYLSIIPKPNEFGICRGLDETKVPHDIPLEWSEFAKVIGLYTATNKEFESINSSVKNEAKTEPKTETKVEELKKVEEDSNFEQLTLDIPAKIEMPKVEETKTEPVKESVKEPVMAEPVKEPVKPVETTNSAVSNADKIAAIKAKLAALKNK